MLDVAPQHALVVGGPVAHTDGRTGIVRMLNRRSRLGVLVAWAHGRLEWTDPVMLEQRAS